MGSRYETEAPNGYGTPDAGASPAGMLNASCQAFVEVSEAPKGKKGTASLVVGIAFVAMGLSGLATGALVIDLLFIVGGIFLIVHARKSVSGRATKTVPVEMSYVTGILSVLMTGSRLFDGAYVDQLYTAMAEDIQAAWFDADHTFHLRVGAMGSTAMRGEEVLEYRSREQTEVTFKTDAEGRRAIEGLLTQAGIPLGA